MTQPPPPQQPGPDWGPPQPPSWGQPQQNWGPPQQNWGPPQPSGGGGLPQQPQWAQPPAYYPPPPPPTLPVEPTEYPQFWRAPGIKVWRPVVAVLLGAAAFFLLAIAFTMVTLALEVALGGMHPDEMLQALEEGRVTPGLVLGNSVAIGLMVPVTLLLARLVKQPSGFLHSVVGRFRWRWFFTCVGVSVVVLGANFALEMFATDLGELDLQVHPYTWWLLIGLMLVTPFQAAAEEYMLRGVVFRTIGSWFRRPALAVGLGTLGNSALFMLMHGAADPWLNLLYFALGALLSWVTWRTGGLEAAAAFHIVNNMFAFSIVPFQDVGGLFDRSAGVAGPAVLWQLLASLAVVAVLAWLARRRNLQRLGPTVQR